MKKYLFLYSVICLFFHITEAFSQSWIPISSEKWGKVMAVNVLHDDDTSYQIEVTVNGIFDQLIANERGIFHRLSFGDVGTLQAIGDPCLPFFSYLVAIPPGTKASPSITEAEWVDIDMPTVWPVQEPRQDGEAVGKFLMNEDTYSHAFLPPLVSKGKEMSWRGISNVGIAVCPFKYYPQEGKLSVMKSFKLRVDFLLKEGEQARRRLQIDESEHLGLFENNVYVEQGAQESMHRSSNYDYLIVACSNEILNSDKMKEFRWWKALKGLKTKAVVLGSSESTIKSYIDQERNNGIKYVLLVGNSSNPPLHSFTSMVNSLKTIYSDYWYGCSNNNTLADIPIGRFPTNQLSEFSNMVDKTIRYEKGQNLSNSTLLMAHLDGAADSISYQGCCEYIRNNYGGNMTFCKAYGADSYGGNNATNADVINYINQGMSIVNYRGHGKYDFWGGSEHGDSAWNATGEAFKSTQISNINGNTNAVFFSVACNTGNMAMVDTCMLNIFMRSTKGASAFVGSTSKSYTEPNHKYDRRMFQLIDTEAASRLGDINMAAHVWNIQHFSPNSSYNTGLAIDNAFSYICGGDPTLEIWTGTPASIPSFNVSSSSATVTVSTGISGGYYVHLSSLDGEHLGSYYTSGTSCTFAKPNSKFYFSVSKHNYIPIVYLCDSETDKLQDITITDNRYFDSTPFAAGEGVDEDEIPGDVILESGSSVIIQKGSGGVLLDHGFKCRTGASIEIK